MTILKGLVIDEPWVSMIMRGEKTWEMRSRNTPVRGRIGLIRKGSGTIVGVADLIGTLSKLSRAELRANVDKHCAPESHIGDDFKHNTAWVLERAQHLRQAVPYRHPRGAVIWVNLDPAVADAVEAQLTGS
jgi:hypothetical protein